MVRYNVCDTKISAFSLVIRPTTKMHECDEQTDKANWRRSPNYWITKIKHEYKYKKKGFFSTISWSCSGVQRWCQWAAFSRQSSSAFWSFNIDFDMHKPFNWYRYLITLFTKTLCLAVSLSLLSPLCPISVNETQIMPLNADLMNKKHVPLMVFFIRFWSKWLIENSAKNVPSSCRWRKMLKEKCVIQIMND